MNNGKISPLQGFMVLGLFILSGGMTIGNPSRDMPAILLISALIALPLYMLYAHLARGDQPLGIFDGLPKWLGNALCLFYALVAIAVAVIVNGVFTRFILSVGIKGGSSWLFAVLLGGAAFFLARSEVEVIGRTAAIIFPLAAILLLLPMLSALPQCDFANLLPMLQGTLKSEGDTLFTVSTSLFGQSFFAIMLLAPGMNGRPWGKTAVIMGIFLALSAACNIALLGFPAIVNYFYPFYAAASAVGLGSVFQRMEIFVAAAFLLCQLFKMALCIAFAKTAIEKVFPKLAHKTALPATVITVLLAQLSLGSLLQMSEGLSKTKYWFALPLYVLPICIAFLKGKAYNAKKRG